MNDENLIDKITSLAKRRGFIFQGSEIYGGLAGTWDYGPLGVALKKNIEKLWWQKFVDSREDMYGIESAILMNPKVWEASGHIEGFTDPMVECKKCKRRYRSDQIEDKKKCIECGGELGEEKKFNMMFKTQIGAVEDTSSTIYLRPENAQGMFVNYKNIIDSIHPKLPFGIAQIGKAFRNEITPRDFTFRTREFNLMEFEYFIQPDTWEERFEYFLSQMREWISLVGIDTNKIHELEVSRDDRAHYSKRTVDFEFDFPFGRKELYGCAYRTDFDLARHQEKSGVNLEYVDEETKEKFLPHVIEPTFGLDRTILAILASSYREEGEGEDMRSFLSLKPNIAPVICAVSPLLKNKPELITKAREVFTILKSEFGRVMWDDNGNIGKRYRRQDEIGTPWCIVIDFDTLGENPELLDTVTIRDRDSGKQERVKISDLVVFIKEKLA